MSKTKVYLDYAATTPVDREVLNAMLPYFKDQFGNAASLHALGRQAGVALEKARQQAAAFFSSKPQEIVFTSGATESNNLAIKGVVKGFSFLNKNATPHIVTSAFEHHSILETCKTLEKEHLVQVSYINPESDGVIKPTKVLAAINPKTILVSIMFVNNEIGTLQPIQEIGDLLKCENKKRKSKIYFHTDATQALNYFDCNVDKLGIDLLSASAHKIYGPKGVGLLYIRQGTLIAKILDGGEQENQRRAGTSNVPAIVGFGKALEKLSRIKEKETQGVMKLRDYLIEEVLTEISCTSLNGSRVKRSPNNANFSFENVEGEALLMLLDKCGIACSTGSACSSSSLSPSHVLLSIGLSPEKAHGSIRMSLGRLTTWTAIDFAVDKLKESVRTLRKLSGNVLKDYYAVF